MHGLDSGPIAHGDIKLSNILVNSDETALICDFGRSRQPRDPSNEVILSSSSPFAGTVRYMSPELLVPESARPSTAADMWAYGCVALEILCRIQPYNETSSDVVVAEMIRSGRIPSDRPRGARGSLINDTLWSVLSSCWRAQDWRPTAEGFLEELNRMLHSGEVPSSPLLMDAIPRAENEPIPAWPSEIKDMRGQIKENSIAVHSRSPRATVWRAWTSTNYSVVIKVPRLNANLDNQVRHDQLEYIFRKIVSSRYGVHHPSIIDFLGITSEFSPHEGLVFEMCFEWTLEQYRMQNPMIPDTYTRSGHLYPNYYSLICDVIEGLRYMHGYPIPISHGDLTPSNISVDGQGKAKISVISFGRILAALPLDATVTSTANSGLAFRWISPELITASIPQPTTESDMWMFGCISFWLLTLQEPYASINRDDLAGIEIMRGRPPATLVSAYHLDTWITNGLWGAIARCWRQDPLQRPSATEFTRILERLEGRSIQWLPLNVTDLAGKVQFDLSKRQERNQIARHQSVWRRFSDAKSEILEEVDVKMGLYEATYTPKWYSRSTSVVIRAGFDFEFRANAVGALYSSIRHEVSLMAQIDHPSIHKLLGIDTSPTHTHLPDMVFEPLSQLTLQLVISQNTASYGERVKILRDVALAVTYLHEHSGGSIAHGDIQPANIFVLPDGKAKLANFTCAFQYISGQLKSSLQWSEVASTPSRPSLYCSPEFRDPFLFPTLAGDVWSFGVVVLAVGKFHSSR
ncbi:kinase-like domain-containing protein [Rhizoctonia solani]|nr:kinase-like domain-containing protein [Rhizoctonia solani]